MVWYCHQAPYQWMWDMLGDCKGHFYAFAVKGQISCYSVLQKYHNRTQQEFFRHYICLQTQNFFMRLPETILEVLLAGKCLTQCSACCTQQAHTKTPVQHRVTSTFLTLPSLGVRWALKQATVAFTKQMWCSKGVSPNPQKTSKTQKTKPKQHFREHLPHQASSDCYIHSQHFSPLWGCYTLSEHLTIPCKKRPPLALALRLCTFWREL